MKTKYLVFIDLDGTLLNDDKIISPYSMKVLNKLKNSSDYILCIASGRPLMLAKYYLYQLNIATPVITNNAANISVGTTGTLLYKKCLPEHETLCFLEYCKKHSLDWAVFFSDRIYSVNTPERLSRYQEYNHKMITSGFASINHIIVSPEDNLSCILKHGAERVSILVHTKEQHRLVQTYFASHKKLRCIRSTFESYDIIHPDVDKWSGVQFIADYYNIPYENTYAFGNDQNDLRMIQNCSHTFAVANADVSILENADIIIDSNNEDGVAKAIDYFLLNK